MDRLYKLQNGTDIRGVACENNEKEVNLTKIEIDKISKAFCIWLKRKYPEQKIKISVGSDSRITGELFRNTCIDSISKQGCDIIDCSMATTPSMFMTTIISEYNCNGAIMITASHLPYYYNGLKFFTPKGGLEKEEIKEVLDIATSNEEKNDRIITVSNITRKDLIKDYSNILVNKIRKEANSCSDYNNPLKGLKIMVDAGNGAGGFFAKDVLEQLGACTEGSQFLDPDGMFPNHIPNPENSEAMKSISNAVLKNESDLGIIFDTDVDRAAIVDSKGKCINKNSLIALVSAIVLDENPNTYIVTDSVTSEGLAKFINEKSGNHHRFKRGYKNVINEAIRLNNEGKECHLAIETSGHAALKENYFLDDGAYLIAKILIKISRLLNEGKKIGDLIKDLEQPKSEKEVRIGINVKDYRPYAESIIEEIKKYVDGDKNYNVVPNNYEGIRVNYKNNGWFLIRLSLHEPLLALNIESNDENGSNEIYENLKNILCNYELIGL